MATPFSRTLRALEAERSVGWLSASISAMLLVLWLGWSVYARISLYASTDIARLESSAASHPVATQAEGIVLRSRLSVGERVNLGDVLVELDAEPQRLALAQAQSRLDALRPVIAAVRDEIVSQQKALAGERDTRASVLAEQAAVVREGEVALKLAEEDARRLERLLAGGLIPTRDYAEARGHVERQTATAEALRSRMKALEPEFRVRESDRQARVDRLHNDLRLLERDVANELATTRRAQNEIELRVVRSPITGQISEAVDLRPGAVLRFGDRVGSVVPGGPLKVVAQFEPGDALGRIRTGQPAYLRLRGFPSAQYGSVQASVMRVADEPRDGKIRVELALGEVPPSLPVQHGLPGDVFVQVERVRPATLVLRTVGGFLTRPMSSVSSHPR